MEVTGIDLFDLNVGMACAIISLALIYFVKIGILHVLKLDSDVHGNHWY